MVLSCPTAIVAFFIVELNSTLYQGKLFVVLYDTKRRLLEYKTQSFVFILTVLSNRFVKKYPILNELHIVDFILAITSSIEKQREFS